MNAQNDIQQGVSLKTEGAGSSTERSQIDEANQAFDAFSDGFQ